MKAAASSWRTCTNEMRSWRVRSASMRPLMPSPGRPKTTRTPQSISRSTKTSDVVVDICASGLKSTASVGLQGLQIFNELTLLFRAQLELEVAVVVVDDGVEGGKPTVVVEAAFLAREQPSQWRGSILFVGRSIGLEIVDADLGRAVHRPSGLGEERRNVTRRTLGLAFEQRPSQLRRQRVETTGRRRGRGNGQLVEMQR